jgi:hypothetical protein
LTGDWRGETGERKGLETERHADEADDADVVARSRERRV